MFCSRCGAENPEGAKFCSKCGAELGVAAKPLESTLQKFRVGEHAVDVTASPIPGGMRYIAYHGGVEKASKSKSLVWGPLLGMGGEKLKFSALEDGEEVNYEVRISSPYLGTSKVQLFRNGKRVE